MVESAVRRNSLTYQFGLVASIKLDAYLIFLTFQVSFLAAMVPSSPL